MILYASSAANYHPINGISKVMSFTFSFIVFEIVGFDQFD